VLSPHHLLYPPLLQADDIIIVSIGGNDVALRPTLSTILSMASLTFCSSKAAIRSGWAVGSGHFRHMYRVDGAGFLKVRGDRGFLKVRGVPPVCARALVTLSHSPTPCAHCDTASALCDTASAPPFRR
jgi:hypothetical protein